MFNTPRREYDIVKYEVPESMKEVFSQMSGKARMEIVNQKQIYLTLIFNPKKWVQLTLKPLPFEKDENANK